eukprot:Gb_08718 [translate_table: standard]
MSFASLNGARHSRNKGSRERVHSKENTNLSSYLVRDAKDRALSIDEQRIDFTVGTTFFFLSFPLGEFQSFCNLFVHTEPLAKSNLVPQDPILALHPPRIYARDITSAMGFGLCRSKMMNGIVALYSPMQKDAIERNRMLCSPRCVRAHVTSELFTLTNAKCLPRFALLLHSNRSLLMLLRQCFFALSSL